MARIIDITDFSAPELDIYARLTENQLVNRADPDNALFVAESPLVIGRALDAGCTPVSFLMERKHITGKGAEVLARCPADIPVYAAELPVLTQLTGFHLTRGMLCAMRRPRLPSVEEVCAGARRIAVLENVIFCYRVYVVDGDLRSNRLSVPQHPVCDRVVFAPQVATHVPGNDPVSELPPLSRLVEVLVQPSVKPKGISPHFPVQL